MRSVKERIRFFEQEELDPLEFRQNGILNFRMHRFIAPHYLDLRNHMEFSGIESATRRFREIIEDV